MEGSQRLSSRSEWAEEPPVGPSAGAGCTLGHLEGMVLHSALDVQRERLQRHRQLDPRLASDAQVAQPWRNGSAQERFSRSAFSGGTRSSHSSRDLWRSVFTNIDGLCVLSFPSDEESPGSQMTRLASILD